MSLFERLHPALQHHVVNSLGWPRLRPLQEAAIAPILEGRDALLIAPTAGGKTEAAFLPVLSRMMTEEWPRLSVVYVCPIKALLNNLHERLDGYAKLVGRRVALWHGDVGPTARKRLLADAPDVLLSTPESLEVILTSPRSKRSAFLHDLRVLVVDEIHAFAGDDRGWQLLSVLERIQRICGRPIQRLGLSATVGNPDDIAAWLAGPRRPPARLVAPPPSESVPVELTLDHVGNLDNAAIVVHRLHRGEKRLVFCDSRSRVEHLATALRKHGTQVFVSHSSLSVSARREAEAAFAEATDCVIVATSTLELGLDVGDLDRVIQIDCPGTVASFLQRLGRTGRRSGSSRNCLFLATNEEQFLATAGLLRLWSQGMVEPVTAPPLPYHVLAQQLLSLTLQEKTPARHLWKEWLGAFAEAAAIEECEVEAIIEHMLETGYLAQDEGTLFIGPTGEDRFGRRNYMDLCSVFSTEPLFTVLHGREELGKVHPLSFATRGNETAVLSLAGRGWRVTHVDWKRGKAQVEPSPLRGNSRWSGSAQPQGFAHCRAMRDVLLDEAPEVAAGVSLTKRGHRCLDELREEWAWLREGEPHLFVDEDGDGVWFTFAGLRANRMLESMLGAESGDRPAPSNLGLPVPMSDRDELVDAIRRRPEGTLAHVPLPEGWEKGLKFSDCLPPELSTAEFASRECAADDVATLVEFLAPTGRRDECAE